MYPCELRRLSVAVRTDASSSMTEITESIDKTGLPEAGARRLPWHCPSQKWASNQDCEIIHRFVDARTRSDKITNAPTFSTNRSGPALRAERNSGMRTKAL